MERRAVDVDARARGEPRLGVEQHGEVRVRQLDDGPPVGRTGEQGPDGEEGRVVARLPHDDPSPQPVMRDSWIDMKIVPILAPLGTKEMTAPESETPTTAFAGKNCP